MKEETLEKIAELFEKKWFKILFFISSVAALLLLHLAFFYFLYQTAKLLGLI